MNNVYRSEHYNAVGPTQPEDINNYFNKYSLNPIYEKSKPAIGFVLPINNTDEGIIQKVMNNELFTASNITSIRFNSESEIDNYTNDYRNLLVASVIFQSNDYLKYVIRVNSTSAPDPYTPDFGNYAESRHIAENKRPTDADKYFSIFAPVQVAVDQAIIRLKTNDETFSYKLNIGKLGRAASDYNGKKSNSGVIATFVSLIFLAPLMMIVTYLVKEKERNIKDGLIMAGVHPTIFWLSWEIIYALIVLIVSIIIVIFFLITKTFSNVNPLILFIALLFYGVSCCSFGFLFTTFFRKSRTAGTVVGLIGFAICVFNIALAYFSGVAKKICAFIFSQFAIGSFIYDVDQMRYSYEDLTFKNLFKSDAGVYLGILLINNVIYFVLAVLLDNFSVGENARYLFGKKKKPRDLDSEGQVTYEKDIQEDYNAKNGEKCMVEVSRVHKIFQKNVVESVIEDGEEKEVVNTVDYLAVNDVSFKVYQNEIFAILGHNGAGKSTLLNIMVGLLRASQGDIYFDGSSLSSDLKKIRRDFGVCPQSNIIFDDLTVEQHIQIYGGIKNADVNVDEILKEVDLSDQKYKKASKLSGGQKRKLCIGLAIIGNPKYIFLDEPTTGLDPLSRRKIWELLLKNKEGRVIFLTTHYMDEADILADRKLILNEGKIRCLGTSLYLKNHFKMNYELTAESADKDVVEEIILRHIPKAVYVPSEESMTKDGLVKSHVWKLPLANTSDFTALFDELESNSEVKKFALSMPTLEELFIRLEDENNQKEDVGKNSGTGSEQVLIQMNQDKLPVLKSVETPSQKNIISTLIAYRLKIFLKNKGFATSAIIYPVIIAAFCFFIADNIFNNKNSLFDTRSISLLENYPQSFINYESEQSKLGFSEDNFKSWSSTNETSSYITNSDVNVIPNPEYGQIYYLASFNGENVGNAYTINLRYNDTMTHAIPVAINAISNAILSSKSVNDQIQISSHPYNEKNETLSQIALMFAVLTVGYCIINCINRFTPVVVRERVNLLLQQLQINGVIRMNYWISTLISDYLVCIITCFLIIIVGVLVRFDPLLDVWECIILIIALIIWAVPTLLYQYNWSFAFNKEETGHSVIAMINFYPVIFGYIASFLICSMDDITGNVYNNGVLFSAPKIIFDVVLTLLCPAYGIVSIMNSLFTMRIYEALYSFNINFGAYFNFKNGFIPIVLTLIFVTFIYFILWIRLDVKKQNLSEESRQFPPKLHRKYEDLLEEGDEDIRDEAKFAYKHQDELPISVIHLSKEYEVRGNVDIKEKKELLKRSQEEFEYGEIHPSIFNEKVLVKTAVVDVNFAVRVRECFGLLGPNGAGKTTTLNAITSSISPTTGKICFYGKEIQNTALSEISMGYCPQINILWKELTLREHLELFLRIRGYNSIDAAEYATQYINACGLEDHQNKPAEKLSGGTKRKLSLLIAICGYPKQILLDEPTAGLDPSTRRYVWNIINDTKKMNESALILTTHSMEEAEQLCDRLAILVNGRFTCIGAPEHLKMRFGEGYILELQSDDVDKFHSEIVDKGNLFGNHEYKMEKNSKSRVKYEVYMNERIGHVFKTMEECKANGLVTDYTFSQTTLEQIFINFAKDQLEEEEDDEKENEGSVN